MNKINDLFDEIEIFYQYLNIDNSSDKELKNYVIYF